MKKICILGGSGFVGRNLSALLVREGHHVTLPTRTANRLRDQLTLPGVEIVEADIHQPDVLEKLFAGKDVVINLVGILHGRPEDFKRAHVDLPAKVAAACAAQGVTRLLHMSALGADATSASIYQQTKAAGETQALAAKGVAVTIFRPSVIFGPGDSFLNLFADLLGLAPVVPLANGHARFQPVHVADVASAFAQSVHQTETFAQTYCLCGPGIYTLAELVAKVAGIRGLRRRIISLPAGPSYWFARMMELKPGRKLMTRDNHYAMQTDNVCPAGYPAIFGKPRDLDSHLGYLGDSGRQPAYDRLRSNAGRDSLS